MNNNLILRTLNSPYGDVNKNSVLSQADVDNNFIFLKGQLIYTATSESGTVTLTKNNGDTISFEGGGGTGSTGTSYWTANTDSITAITTNTVYVPKLNINTLNTGTSVTLLAIDSDGNVVPDTMDLGNILFVSENGDDSTAEKGNIHKPYRTLYAAKTGSTSGDTIYVFPQTIVYDNSSANGNPWNGRSEEINLWKDGVKYYFSLGVKITIINQTVIGNALALFNPKATSGETCTVDGYLEYEQIGYGSDTSNGVTNYFVYEDANAGGCYFYSKTKKLTSRHSELYRIQTYSTAQVYVFDESDEQVWQWAGQGQSGSGGCYLLLGGISNSNINFNSKVRYRNFASSKGYSFYIRQNLENSKINISGDYLYSYNNVMWLRQLYCRNINIKIKEIDYWYGQVPFALTGSILSTGIYGGSWTLNLDANLNDAYYENNNVTLGLFYLQTGTDCIVNFKGDINTKTASGVGRFIVGNNTNNSTVNIEGNINLMGTGTTTNIILQAYSTGSVTNFKGKIEGNYTFLAHPRLGGTVNINNSEISSTANNFVMLDHTDTTLSTFRMNNSYVKGKNDINTFADGQYLNTLIDNSTIINTGSGSTITNVVNSGTLQILNSSVYSNSGASINYTLSGASVISSNTTVNTPYSATTLYGDITTLTNLIY